MTAAVVLARIQFAVTAGFHFLFPPLTIGMAWVIVFLMFRWMRHGDPLSERIARFWVKLFAISFAIGVATGITLEFEFGTNWSQYSRFVGDIFGAPLAAEGVFAFFMESTFVGVLLFGWNRVSRRTMFVASLMTAVGATMSAFWIIVANSWMQTPTAYEIVGGRAELTDFWAAIFNPSTLPRYTHTVVASLATGAFFMMGISAWYLYKNRHTEVAGPSFAVALIFAFVASVLQPGTGHWHAVQVARTQPEKLAAIEGLFTTRTAAPLLAFGIPDVERREVDLAIELPGALSRMAFGDANAEVKGLDAFPRSEWPPVTPVFWSFHLMVWIGSFMLLLTTLGVWFLFRGTVARRRWFLLLAMLSLPLPTIANQLGWITAEVGRQPWIVYGLMKTAEAASVSVPAWQVAVSLVFFTVLYAALGILWLVLLVREIAHGPAAAAAQPRA